jgi:putative tryptophan/tyrosine transport system substrate-binding protein
MRKNIFCVALCVVLFAFGSTAGAQQTAGVPLIGFLITGSAGSSASNIEAFRQGLRELGYVEGKNIRIEYKYADGRSERLPELAKELVRLKVDILVASSSTAARPARKVTATIPIVLAAGGNLDGLVANLARPGGNVTGLYQYSPELFGKRLELLKEVVPKVSRFAFLNGADGIAAKAEFEAQGPPVAKVLGVELQAVEVKPSHPDFEGEFQNMVKRRIGAVVTSSSPLVNYHRKKVLQLLEQHRLPAIHPDQRFTNDGGLMAYGVNHEDLYRRAATYVDKILKRTKPADLPVEQPMKFELVINLKAAKQIGLAMPPNVLARADEVIR